MFDEMEEEQYKNSDALDIHESDDPSIRDIAGDDPSLSPTEEQPGTETLDGGVAAIRTILNLIGLDIAETDMTKVVEDLLEGWDRSRHFIAYQISLQDIQKVLEWAEMEVLLLENGTFHDIFTSLSIGKQVILEVDLGELTGEDLPFSDLLFGQDADHVCLIKNFDLSDPNNPMVTLYALDGSAKEGFTIPLSVLRDAWADGNYTYLVVDPSGLEDSAQPSEDTVESREASARYA